MNKWEQFSRKFLQIYYEDISDCFEKHKEEIGEATLNEILGLNNKHSIDREVSRKDEFHYKLFNGIAEINDSKDNLKNIPEFIKDFPYETKNIPKHQYLRYHIENYFHEVYILKERLKSYLNIIQKLFQSDSHYRIIYKVTQPLFKKIKNPLKGIIKTRSQHVHKSRFQDEDLSRLETLELFKRFWNENPPIEFEIYYDLVYEEVKEDWYKNFIENNKQIDKILSMYGKALLKILFKNDEEKLIYPDDLSCNS